ARPPCKDAPIKIKPRPGWPLRRLTEIVAITPELVVYLTLFRVGQYVVGLREMFELFFRSFITGIEVGMIFTRKPAIHLANFFLSRGAFNAERFVIIFALTHKISGE